MHCPHLAGAELYFTVVGTVLVWIYYEDSGDNMWIF